MDWQKVNMAFMPTPPVGDPLSGTSETSHPSVDDAYVSLRTKIGLLKNQLEIAKEEWKNSKLMAEPTPWISLSDLAHRSRIRRTTTPTPPNYVDASFSSDDAELSTEPGSLKEEMELLREQIDRAEKWSETTIKPAPPVVNGFRPSSGPLNDAKWTAIESPKFPDFQTISSPQVPGKRVN
jgi:hypothetical protein